MNENYKEHLEHMRTCQVFREFYFPSLRKEFSLATTYTCRSRDVYGVTIIDYKYDDHATNHVIGDILVKICFSLYFYKTLINKRNTL